MPELITKINSEISALVWGTPMLILILSIGIFYTFKTGFFQFRYIKLISQKTILAIFKDKSVRSTSDKKSITQLQALSTALAATIGTGSIAGVATAITLGGAGAVFWMWMSAILGMMTIYAENVLGICFRRKNKKGEWCGGAMYYIEHGLHSKWLAVLFAVFCVLASFGMGNMTQSNAISGAMNESFHVPEKLTGLIFSLLTGLVILGGIKRIGKVAERVIPTVTVLYIIACCAVIFLNINIIPEVIERIFKEAFGLGAVSGGISGAMVKKAVSMGVRRGVFSNEAGLGSSVTVHSAADVNEPAVQGMWGIFEVFIDTIVVCSLTAFVILTGGKESLSDGAPLVIQSFRNGLGGFASVFVSGSVIIFAFATIIGWSYMGEKAAEYIFGERSVYIYRLIFTGFVYVGAVSQLELVWSISDTFNALMAIPNLIALALLSGTVFKVTDDYLKKQRFYNF
ncbi:MAG: alanine/glycine:cation symporter family protein [Oscillospiraceae bacterium]